MRSPRSLPASLGIRLFLLCAAASMVAAACSDEAPSGDASLVVEVLPDEVTVENQTGTPLVGGEISVIPYGTVPRPYVMNLSRLSTGEKRSFALTSFRNPDGTRFMRSVAKGRRLKVTAKGVGGKSYEREVPFR